MTVYFNVTEPELNAARDAVAKAVTEDVATMVAATGVSDAEREGVETGVRNRLAALAIITLVKEGWVPAAGAAPFDSTKPGFRE